jgi:outer membrane immunogenic protein
MAKLVAAGLFLLALAGSAAAADIRAPVRKAPPAPLPPSWTGFYVGAHVGYGWDDRDVNLAGADPHVLFSFPPLPDLRFPSRGPLGGFQLGFNWQLAPQWLIGLEADFSWASIKGDATAAYSIPPVLLGPIIPAADAASERIRSLGTVRGRLGVLAAPDVLLYVTGGYA